MFPKTIFVLLIASAAKSHNSCSVHTKHGLIIGRTNRTGLGTEHCVYQGIPYAKPPIGNLRFEPPVETSCPNLLCNATYERSVCTQGAVPIGDEVQGEEDCLYLNVYSPKLAAARARPLPVLVWFFGGAWLIGSGNYDQNAPDNFIDKRIIFVSFNYRLGVFGFFSTGDAIVPGNMGLKDQVLALKWVKENVEKFGGDPNNITIYGVSAGAASVSYLVQSPRVKGYFNRAIMESGNSLMSWALSRDARRFVRHLAWNFGVLFNINRVIVTVLKSIDYRTLNKIASAVMYAFLFISPPLNGLLFAPVIETPNPTAIITYDNFEQLSKCDFDPVDIIVGFNSEEVPSNEPLTILIQLYFARLDLFPRNLVPGDMNAEMKCNVDDVGNRIKEQYVGDGLLTVNAPGLTNYLTDRLFIHPTIKYAEMYSKCNPNTYLYRFSYNCSGKCSPMHTQEYNFIFAWMVAKGQNRNAVTNNIVSLWSNFVNYGNPSGLTSENIWPGVAGSTDYYYLDITEELNVVPLSMSGEKKNMDYWENEYERCGTRKIDIFR